MKVTSTRVKTINDQALEEAARQRSAAIEFGFSEDAAEAMAVSVHSMYLATQLNPDP